MGEIFQGWVTVNSAQEALKVVAKAATHATVQGTIGTIDGGDFGSSFLSGFAGSMMGTAGDALKWGSVGTVSSAMLMGGVSSELSGGEFWRGAAIGGIVAGANHVAHRVGASAEERVREKRQQPKLMDVTERFNNQLNATRAFFSDVNEMFNKMYPDPIAREAAKIAFFTEMVKTNAPFDIKVKGKGFSPGEIGGQQALYNGRVYNFDDFGNYNFGVAAQALGLSENFAVFGAGFYQTFFQPTNDWSNWRGFFDHAQDTKMIRTGYNHFK